MNYRIYALIAGSLLFAATFWAVEQLVVISPAVAQSEFSCDDVSDIPRAECEALEAMTTANPQLATAGWLSTDTPCSWTGISCSTGNVTALSLPDLGLQSIPPEIANLNELLSLDLSGNDLTSLPEAANNLSKLNVLNLSNNSLTVAPNIQAEMTGEGEFTWNLGELDLRNNQLTVLPGEILEAYSSGFINLELDGNSVPSEVLLGYEEGYYDCTTITEPSQAECEALVAIFATNLFPFLDLSGWIEGSEPCTWEGVSCSGANVTELRLPNEGLTEIPEEVESLAFLTYLDVSNNDLTSLPAALNRLPALETLDVSGNPLAPTALTLENEPQREFMLFVPLLAQ